MRAAIVVLGMGLAPVGASAQDSTVEVPTVACPADETSRCLQVPGVAVPPEGGERPVIIAPLGPWSASVAGGVAPRDGGPTGAYGMAEVRRQVGHGYVQVGAMHYEAPLLSNAASVASHFDIGTVAGGGHIGNWIVDGYASYGWQRFGKVRVEDASGANWTVRQTDGRGGSPYYGAGLSFGRIAPVGERWFVTPTVSVVYAWGRWLHPMPAGGDFTTGETTWTGTARLRVDRMMGRTRRSYLGLSVAQVASSNASSFSGGGASGGGGVVVVGPGVPDLGAGARRLRDAWVEIGGHGSLALSRRLRAEVAVARTAGLVTGDTTTINMGLRRQF